MKTTPAKILAAVRTGLRNQLWKWHPIKKELIDSMWQKKPVGKAGREVKALPCAMCNEWYPQSKVQVDHIVPVGALSFDNVEDWANRLVNVSLEDLQLLCKPCHDVKTYMDRHNCCEETARCKKFVANFFSKHKTAKKQDETLDKMGYNSYHKNKCGRVRILQKIFYKIGE